MANVIRFTTVAAMQLDTSLGADDVIEITERGGALFKMVAEASPSQANTNDKIVAHSSLSLVAEFIDPGEISAINFGLKTNDENETAAINRFFKSEYQVLRFDAEDSNDYLVNDQIVVGENKTIIWGENFLKAKEHFNAGGVLSFRKNNTVFGVKVDGNGSNGVSSDGKHGMNGLGALGTGIKIYGAIVKNCYRGTEDPWDGGKAIQAEGAEISGGTDVELYGLSATSCHMAVSARRDNGQDDERIIMKVFGLRAEDCNIVLFAGIMNFTSPSEFLKADEFTVELNGFYALNCGDLGEVTTPSTSPPTYALEAKAGLFQFNKASNVLISNGTVSGTTKVEGIFRSRPRACTISNVKIDQNCDAIINLDRTEYASSDMKSELNNFDINYYGSCDYVCYGSTGGSQYMTDSTIKINLKSDVSQKIVTDGMATGNAWLSVRLANKKAEGNADDFKTKIAKMADVSDGSTVENVSKLTPQTNPLIVEETSAGFPLEVSAGDSGVSPPTGLGWSYLTFSDKNVAAKQVYLGCVGDTLNFYTGNSNKMKIASDGKVGIGTTSPDQKLHVKESGASAAIRIETNSSSHNATLSLKSPNKTFNLVADDTNDTFSIKDSTSQRITIDSSGNVGIGTTSPSSKLDVSGDVEIGSADAFYFGAPTATVGSWRVVRSGNDLLFQRCTSTGPDVWTTKSTISG